MGFLPTSLRWASQPKLSRPAGPASGTQAETSRCSGHSMRFIRPIPDRGRRRMRGLFIDCTEDLARVIDGRGLPVPAAIKINAGNPTDSDIIRLAADVQVLLVEHTVIPRNVLDA